MNKTNILYLDNKFKEKNIEAHAFTELQNAEDNLRAYCGTLKSEIGTSNYDHYISFRENLAFQIVILKYRLMQ